MREMMSVVSNMHAVAGYLDFVEEAAALRLVPHNGLDLILVLHSE